MNPKFLVSYSRYDIYPDGRIFDIKLNKNLSFQKNTDGYLCVTLRADNNKRKTFRIHRILALCFIPNTENKKEINHKNGIKTDNSLSNLEWCSHSENIQHAWDTKLLQNTPQRVKKLQIANQDKFGAKNHKSKKVRLVNTGEVFESGNMAASYYNITQAQLNRSCNSSYKTAGKHPKTKEKIKWEFVNE